MDENRMNGYRDLERLLKQELQPRDAPPGFGTRLAERLAETAPGPANTHALSDWTTAFRSAAIVTVALGLASGGYWVREYRIHLAGEHARNQVLLALHITANTLTNVQHKVAKEK